MSKKTDKALAEVMERIEALGDPKRMSKREWIDFLSEIETDCSIRREAAEQGMAAEAGDDD